MEELFMIHTVMIQLRLHIYIKISPPRVMAENCTFVNLSIHQVFVSLCLSPCPSYKKVVLWRNKTLHSLHQQMRSGDRRNLSKCVFSVDIEN